MDPIAIIWLDTSMAVVRLLTYRCIYRYVQALLFELKESNIFLLHFNIILIINRLITKPPRYLIN